MTYQYFQPDYGEMEDDAIEFDCLRHFEDEATTIAEDAAMHLHCRGDGWDKTWPIKLTICEDGVAIGTFSVQRHTVPEFEAEQVQP